MINKYKQFIEDVKELIVYYEIRRCGSKLSINNKNPEFSEFEYMRLVINNQRNIYISFLDIQDLATKYDLRCELEIIPKNELYDVQVLVFTK